MTNPVTALATRTARWSAARPWRAIAVWFAFVVLAVGLASMVPTVEAGSAGSGHGDSGRAAALLASAGFDDVDSDSEDVLVTARSGPLDDVAARAVGAAVAAAMAAVPGVVSVAPAILSPTGNALLVAFSVDANHDDPAPYQAVTAAVQRAYPDLTVRETGDLTVDQDIDDRVMSDLHSAELLSLPLTLVLMLMAFGALIAAGLPVLLAATSVTATIGLLAPISHLVPVDDTVTSMIVLIGMAVGVDYSLFYLKREREERAKGHVSRDAVAIAAETSGHSIVVSGCAVMGAMAGLLLMSDATFDSLAVGAILVVGVAVTGSLTVLPALLVKLGRWVDRPRVPLLSRVGGGLASRVGPGGVSRTVLGPVTRHPALALGLSVTAVVLLAVPAFGMKTHNSNLATLPQGIASVQTLQDLSREFPSEHPTADLVVRAPASERSEMVAAVGRLEQAADRTSLYRSAGVSPQISPDGRTVAVSLPMAFGESDPRVDRAIAVVRTELAPQEFAGLDATYAVGGDAAESMDWSHLEQQRLPFVIGFVLLLTLLLMGFTFRSVAIALLSALLNLASVGVAFGIITLVFQDGWFAGTLDFTSPGFVIDWLPIFVMAILIGLSMDYHVFVLSRIREHVGRGLPTRVAVERGIADTAGVVTSAAGVMVAVFSIFATLSLLEMKTMGVGLAAAILLDTTLIRLVMLPAALCLLGDRAWWPARRPRPVGAVVAEPEPAHELTPR